MNTKKLKPVLMALWRCFLVCFLFSSGCAAFVPAPRYTSKSRDGNAEVVEELEKRQRANSRADKRRLLEIVDSYMGVPYRWGGSSRKGMDCSGLVRAIYREAYGLELPRSSREMYQLGERVTSQKWLKVGDLVFFKNTTAGPGISHVGVYVGKGRFVHASPSQGSVVAPLTDPYFQRRYVGARRVLR